MWSIEYQFSAWTSEIATSTRPSFTASWCDTPHAYMVCQRTNADPAFNVTQRQESESCEFVNKVTPVVNDRSIASVNLGTDNLQIMQHYLIDPT
jgi:hypothetical protein